MKKFLSMVMAAAMVVSLVPATAFAASSDVQLEAKVVDAENYTQDEIEGTPNNSIVSGPELQLRVTTADYSKQNATAEITLSLDNANFVAGRGIGDADFTGLNIVEWAMSFVSDRDGETYYVGIDGKMWKHHSVAHGNQLMDRDNNPILVTDVDFNNDKDEVTIKLEGKLTRGDMFYIPLASKMDSTSRGKSATVSVDSSDVTIKNGDDLTYASVEAKGIKASVKKAVDVATEEFVKIEEVKVEPSVGNDFTAVIDNNDFIRLKLNSGFEFTNATVGGGFTIENKNGADILLSGKLTIEAESDNDEIILKVVDKTALTDVIKFVGLQVEATSAKAGSTANLRIYADGSDTVSVEVAKVVEYSVSMTVDEDEDVPVIYSGVNVANEGITDDNDHEALEVTLKETFPGAWNNAKDFTLSLPEGVYVADTIKTGTDGDFYLASHTAPNATNMKDWFEAAYDEGNYVDLTFERRGWDETKPGDKAAEVTFTLTLVADPNFEGDVVLKLTGDAMEEQEVTIAKFVKPFVVEAQQNDMQIDYRNTEIPTSVVIKEAEAGLWAKGTKFELALDKISFDDEGTIKVDEKSGLELKDDKVRIDRVGGQDVIYFTVDSRSDDEPATVTLSGMQLYMDRSLPAGAYDLDVYSPTMLYGKDNAAGGTGTNTGYLDQLVLSPVATKDIEDINEDFYSTTAKAGFVNIVTAGREDTDSFTTKVVVPVGESYLISGENKVTIDVPAYINANGYTMLPLRAVAKALGINENNVLWDQASRTATVMYGSKIISMTYGQKVVYVNAAPIPASTSVEIKENRMFLGLRDLGNALGVTDITWDAATKTATLNGSK
ncbi:hypothetical protein B5G26_01050 [Anaerotignum lactatifermentans]|uniref:Copper amine oxidase-like N-terminal domain-containing protein n=1 Tax=Anaerotignum lactatifermentans TaxID=160404 RepID=A0A1Y3UA05_9FIRM|nr:copper amine oxidase N-terminal domain-containing protein [Anaerotignum lactatifermentans]OUN45642.1 hypothetical protein B5G26_01050 [Anaerotignum lactatifermentans]